MYGQPLVPLVLQLIVLRYQIKHKIWRFLSFIDMYIVPAEINPIYFSFIIE